MTNRENQQGTTTTDIAWLAGIIEGEGTVALSAWRRSESVKPKIGVHIKVYNTDAGIIGKCVEILENLDINYHLRERETKPMPKPNGEGYYGGHDPMLTITVSHLPEAYKLARILYEFMWGQKKERLALIIQYLARRLQKTSLDGKNAPYDLEDIRLVAAFYKQFVKRNGANRELVDGLLNEYEQNT